jgi:hypothetical protein
MAKIVSSAMETHLNQEVTSLCACWKVDRPDGAVYCFTDHDQDLTYNGNLYLANTGFTRTSMASTASLAASEGEVEGFIDSDTITERDLRAGLFDYADVELFYVNWANPDAYGAINIRNGKFGEVTITSSGKFKVELRGLVARLSNTIGRTFMSRCDADLGDSRCKVKLVAPERIPNFTYAAGDRIRVRDAAGVKLAALPIPNADFEEYTLDVFGFKVPTGWTGVGTFFVTQTWFQQQAATPGGYFFVIEGLNGDGAGGFLTCQSQTFSLTSGGGITGADIDTGLFSIDLQWLAVAMDVFGTAGVGIKFLNASGDVIQTYAAEQLRVQTLHEWITQTRTVAVPVGARQAFIMAGAGTWSGSNIGFAHVKASVDTISGIIRPTSMAAADYNIFGNVEYLTTAGGTVDATIQTGWSRTLGATIADGGVTWTAVAPQYNTIATVTAVTSRGKVTVDYGLGAENRFRFGTALFLSGLNAGMAKTMLTAAGNDMSFDLPFPYPPAVGDRMLITFGCDKSILMCFNFFLNQVNFRGFPFMPGTDQYFRVGGPAH